VLWFSLAGWRLLLLASFAALAFGRDARLALGNGDLLDELLQWRWPRIFGAVRRGDAGGGGLHYSASDRQPDGQPGSAGISSGAAFGVVLMLFFVPGMRLAGCCLPAVSARRSRC
jgi:iron complex transport system permease protein